MTRVPEPVVHLVKPYTRAQWRYEVSPTKRAVRKFVKRSIGFMFREAMNPHPFLTRRFT